MCFIPELLDVFWFIHLVHRLMRPLTLLWMLYVYTSIDYKYLITLRNVPPSSNSAEFVATVTIE